MAAKLPPFPTSKQLRPVAQKFGVRLIVLFGSAARGKVHAESDIDVGVLMERYPTFNRRLKLWQALCEIFRAEIDLAVLNHATPLLKFQVARDGKVLFQRHPAVWANWKSYAFRQYWDTKKFRDDLRKYISRAAEEMRHAAS